MRNSVALNYYLSIFAPFFEMEHVTELCINRPGELWVEQQGQFACYALPDLTLEFLWQFARLVAESNQREISPEYPTLSSILPNGLRVQFVVEPACEQGSFVCSIRQHSVQAMHLADYFASTVHQPIKQTTRGSATWSEPNELLRAYQREDYLTFLRLAVLHRKNIIISGGTSTGKTTLLNSFLDLIPQHERLITIETDREVRSSHRNVVHLLAAEEGLGVASITMLTLLKVALRLRPDRILVSELRAEEAFPYLRAINSGHPGSITTLHADSPLSCFDQLAFMVMQSGSQLSRQELVAYAKSIINVVVQIKRTTTGQRYISEIYFDEAQSPRVSEVKKAG